MPTSPSSALPEGVDLVADAGRRRLARALRQACGDVVGLGRDGRACVVAEALTCAAATAIKPSPVVLPIDVMNSLLPPNFRPFPAPWQD